MLTHADRIQVVALIDLLQAFLDVAAVPEDAPPIPADQLDAIARQRTILTGLRDRLDGVDHTASEARHAWEAALGLAPQSIAEATKTRHADKASLNASTEDELFAAWEAELLRKNRGKTRPRHANAE